MGENKKLGPSGLELLWAKVLSAIKNFAGEVDVSKDGNLQTQVNTLKNKTNVATTSTNGLMSSTDKTKLDGIATGATKVSSDTVSGWGFTKNAGTVTGIKMNGASKGTSGVVDLGTVLTGGSQTSTSSADGGSNVYTFSDGSTITVKNGTKGSKGDTGATGPQGNPGTNGTNGTNGTSAAWFTGTAVTGNATTATAFTVSGSKAGDMYLNTSTQNVYKATAANSWVYVCNIKGATGSQGNPGTNGTNGVTPTIKAAAGANIGTVGTPSVTASTSGTTTTFTFNNLKGAKGDKGDPGTNATTTAVATPSANGLMSGTDKARFDKTNSINIMFGKSTTAAATQLKEVTLDDATYKPKDNDIIAVWFTNTNSFSATADAGYPQLKIDGVTYEIYTTFAKGRTTGTNTTYYGNANYLIYYKLDVTNKCAYWMGHSWDNNTTYSPQSLGIGYGTCTTAEATVAKVVTLSGYNLVTNGLVAVKFTYKVPAAATLNINSKGAKAIYRNGAAITAGKIQAGDVALFIYNGSQYELLATSSYGTQDSNTWTAMKGATASAAGGAGYVPAPAAGANTKFLRGDGTWQTVLPTTLSASLAANATSLVFSNSIITTSSRITVYAADATVGYTNITTVAGKTTITFPSTHNATTVYIDVLNI